MRHGQWTYGIAADADHSLAMMSEIGRPLSLEPLVMMIQEKPRDYGEGWATALTDGGTQVVRIDLEADGRVAHFKGLPKRFALAALVPPPQKNSVIYHGVLGHQRRRLALGLRLGLLSCHMDPCDGTSCLTKSHTRLNSEDDSIDRFAGHGVERRWVPFWVLVPQTVGGEARGLGPHQSVKRLFQQHRFIL
jgi:hypothetical protein